MGQAVDLASKLRIASHRFVTAHATISNLFKLGRHLVRAQHYRNLRTSALADWSRAVA
jgi:putative transposase